jgi:hypothetical protein
MKKQFLREVHNLQDKAKKTDYRERFQDEGDNFDRGGVVVKQKSAVWIKGNTIHFNVISFLNNDKRSLLETLRRHWKFHFHGKIGTISQLLKDPHLAPEISDRFEMTERSIRRALELVDQVKHPKKNRLFEVIEFTCFLQPVEPFANLIFKESFAFRVKIAKQKS